jgi:two-component system, NarL family, sensor histidine kinase UhpB
MQMTYKNADCTITNVSDRPMLSTILGSITFSPIYIVDVCRMTRSRSNSVLVLLMFFLWTGHNPAFSQHAPMDISKGLIDHFEQAVYLMNISDYDSAQQILSKVFLQTEFELSNTDLFYLHSLETEIMYYSALFELGLTTAIHAHALVENSNDNIQLGSAENLLGLMLMNMDKTDEALIHLRKAVQLLPKYHGNSYLSFNYHAVANIGECFIRLQMPDSAIIYSSLSLEEADSLGKERGLAIALWNISEALLMQGRADAAISKALEGIGTVQHTNHRDVVQIFCSTMMRAHETLGSRDSALHYLQLGLKENEDVLNTDFSRLEFLDAAAALLIRMRQVEKASDVLNELHALSRSIGAKEQKQQIEVLKQFYEKNRQLAVTNALNESQKIQLKLQLRQQLILAVMVVLLAAVLALAYGTFRQRQRIQQMQFSQQMLKAQRNLEIRAAEERVKALNEERNRIASDLHDDIGASLSSIRIYSEAALIQAANDHDEGMKLLGRIRTTAAGVMERMGDIVWSISPRNDSMENLLLRMKSYAGDTLDPMGITPTYTIDLETLKIQPGVLARKNLYLIFKEALNNAAKYSNAQQVLISVQIQDERLTMEVSDNGVGFNPDNLSPGNGLKNMSERAKAIGAELFIMSKTGNGTTVKLLCKLANISDTIDAKAS